MAQSDPRIRNYFVQTQPTPVEGAHAREVAREEFFTIAEENLNVPISFDHNTAGLYLRFDLPLMDVV